MVSGFELKIYQVFWREKSCTVQMICLVKIQDICLISDWTLFKSAEFFFFAATLHSQKIVKEIAYISSSSQAPFKSANFFQSIFLLNKSKTMDDRHN